MPRVQHMALGLLGALVVAAPAVAQEPGVTIDPGSPSAKQYVLPLESARQQADPTSSGSARIQQGSTTAQLFGAGVDDSGSAGGGVTSSRSSGSSNASVHTRSARARKAKGASPTPPAAVQQAIAQPGAPGGGLGSSMLVVGGALLVLLAGAGIGIVARRRAR